jgi:ABC-type lipoprotein release transport system permease subunit
MQWRVFFLKHRLRESRNDSMARIPKLPWHDSAKEIARLLKETPRDSAAGMTRDEELQYLRQKNEALREGLKQALQVIDFLQTRTQELEREKTRDRYNSQSWRHMLVQRPLAFLSAALTLAAWRWRQQWLLLFITGIGVTIAVVLICSLPLFSSVMSTAGVRNVLRATPTNAQIVANAEVAALSSAELASTTSTVTQQLRQDLGAYVQANPQAAINTSAWAIPNSISTLQLYGTSMDQARAHLRLTQGRLPADQGDHLEVALTNSAAYWLHVKIGSVIALTSTFQTDNGGTFGQVLPARVVGIFSTQDFDPYWNGIYLEGFNPVGPTAPPPFEALTSRSLLLSLLDTAAGQHSNSQYLFGDNTTFHIFLTYELIPGAITNSELTSVISQLGRLQKDVQLNFDTDLGQGLPFANQAPYIANLSVSGAVFHTGTSESILEKVRDQSSIARMPLLLLTLQIGSLILFFVGVMAGALVERQHEAIAVLRSRGASRWQVLATLITQGLALCLLAGLCGPLLATGLVYLLTPHFLSANTQDAINALAHDPQQALAIVAGYALAASGAALLTMLFSLYRATQATILTQRRETARSTRRPLWQRLRLDFALAVVALVCYGFAVYVESTQQLLDVQSSTLLVTPLALLAPLLLLFAGILCFIRLFPYLLRLVARLAQRRRDVSSMLALAQMERAPHQFMRMALLLGLATAFTLFSLVFSASQNQRARDLAAYQAGADFSGQLSSPLQSSSLSALARETASYQHIRGVTSATLGCVETVYLYVTDTDSNSFTRQTQLRAVDASTFARTAMWSSQDSSQPLSELMAQLVAQRQQAEARNVVPAIVAASTWRILGLRPGSTFNLTDTNGDPSSVTYQAIAEVEHIPPVDDSIQGAVLVDYQTLATISAASQQSFSLNYAWLRTSDNPADVAHVRQVLSSPALALGNLQDRRALIAINDGDPLALNLLSALSLGVGAALLLALLANILLPVLNVRARLTSFAVLRALGTRSAQVTHILTWEQGITLVTALLLGLLFGALLALAAVPPLIFTGAPPAGMVDLPNVAVYTLQKIIPVTVIFPPSLALALLGLLALGLMTRIAQRPLLAQVLRLNED